MGHPRGEVWHAVEYRRLNYGGKAGLRRFRPWQFIGNSNEHRHFLGGSDKQH
jgi:hypothetical protein